MKKIIALTGLALLLSGAVLVSGCGRNKPVDQVKKVPIMAAPDPEKEFNSIIEDTRKYAKLVDQMFAEGDSNNAIYRGGQYGDEIKKRLKNLGYIELKMVRMGEDGSMADYFFTESGLRLIDENSVFAKDYFRLNFPVEQRKAAHNALDQ